MNIQVIKLLLFYILSVTGLEMGLKFENIKTIQPVKTVSVKTNLDSRTLKEKSKGKKKLTLKSKQILFNLGYQLRKNA